MFQNDPIFAPDLLLCDEGSLGEDESVGKTLALQEPELLCDDDEVLGLKEKEAILGCGILDLDLMMMRNEAVEWILRVVGHYGFSASTAVLAVNYLDRFISGVWFQKDKPWMSQLAALACLSVAAKMEEIDVPLLVDLQVAESKFVFEAKTIQRMELLVMSNLQWRMNLVTPISFIDYIIRRFNLMSNLHWEFFGLCQRLILSVISDPKLLQYLPSVIATAIILIIIKEIDPHSVVEYNKEILSVLQINKDQVDDCIDLIIGLTGDRRNKLLQRLKRKHESGPGSPNGVIDAYFSSDSSSDSWAVSSSSPGHLHKRIRA